MSAGFLVINGSPRANGRSSRIERLLLSRLHCDYPGEVVDVFRASDTPVRGCVGCDYCEQASTCVMDDEMAGIIGKLLSARAVFVVSPIYFSGVPSQMKAVRDRLQPLFFRRMRKLEEGQGVPPKRPLVLYLVGEGGDPHGYEPAVTECKSAFNLADLSLTLGRAFIGADQPRVPDDLPIPDLDVRA